MSESNEDNGKVSTSIRPHRTKHYLKEKDRLQILERIQKGDRQEDLAKEFQVSRAAISNLKQRRKRKKQETLRDLHEEDDGIREKYYLTSGFSFYEQTQQPLLGKVKQSTSIVNLIEEQQHHEVHSSLR
jgi:transcriptional regulator with XRE-family HTH domain